MLTIPKPNPRAQRRRARGGSGGRQYAFHHVRPSRSDRDYSAAGFTAAAVKIRMRLAFLYNSPLVDASILDSFAPRYNSRVSIQRRTERSVEVLRDQEEGNEYFFSSQITLQTTLQWYITRVERGGKGFYPRVNRD